MQLKTILAFWLGISNLLLPTSLFAQSENVRKDYAVFFYVSEYENGWTSLPETAVECKKLEKELRENYGFDCKVVPNPSKQEIKDIIRQYNDIKYGSGDQLLLFFSMHGSYDERLDRGFLIPRDGKVKKEDQYGDSWLKYSDLKDDLTLNACQHILLGLDACNSGSFGISKGDGPDFEQMDDCAVMIKRTLSYKSRLFLCAGGKDVKVPGKSIFASKWLECLQDRQFDALGLISMNDLKYRLGKIQSPKIQAGEFADNHTNGDFIFIRKNACPTDLSTEFVIPKKQSPASSNTTTRKILIEDSDFLPLPAGKFIMGCPTNAAETCMGLELPAHEVSMKAFFISNHEVTQAEWYSVMGAYPPGLKHKSCDQCPVENVSWNDVQAFLQKLNAIAPGHNYRLPTEAEWEYAARGGENGVDVLYSGSLQFDDVAWTNKNIPAFETQPVMGKNPNSIGLYDMSGNVFEWCSDWYGPYSTEYRSNPTGPTTGTYRILRGGSWESFPLQARSTSRYFETPDFADANIGFRLVKSGKN